jgi:allantoicase
MATMMVHNPASAMPKPAPTALEKLMGLPPSAERDQMIAEWFAASERIDAFISAQRSQKITELETKRADLWSKCRQAEEAVKAAVVQLGQANVACNVQGQELNAARGKAAAADQPSYNTRFPTEAEKAADSQKRTAAQKELTTQTDQFRALRDQLSVATLQHHDAQVNLQKLVEELRLVDSELNALKKVT